MADLKIKKYAGVILAGGKSRRFLCDKAFYKPKGARKTWIEKAVEEMIPLVSSLYISINEHQFQQMNKLFSKDPQIIFSVDDKNLQDYGPLGGLYQVNKIMTECYYLLSPVDMPKLTADEWRKLLRHPNHYVKTPKHHHYLVACLPKNALILQNLIQSNEHRVVKWLALLKTKPLFFEDDEPFQNFNYLP